MSARRPTILQIIPALETGGAELSAVEIAEALVQAGARAIVASAGGRLAERIVRAGGELAVLPLGTKSPFGMLANAGALARMIRNENVSLVHARSRAPAWSGLIAARRTGRPFVTTYHGAYGEKGRMKRFYNGVMARGDVVIANSRWTADLIQARYGTTADRSRVIPRGVEMVRFAPTPELRARGEALRTAWGVPRGVPVILQVARLTAWKGQGTLIAAAARLDAEGRLGEAVIVLAGDDQGRDGYRAALETQIRAAGLAGRVVMPGHVADVAAAYATAHVTVVASIEPEAFGRAAAESLAAGAPAIVTALGAPPEIVRAAPGVPASETTGWVVPAGDAEALAIALEAALQLSPSEHAAMAVRATRSIGERFTLAAMQRQTLAVYDEILGTDLAGRFERR